MLHKKAYSILILTTCLVFAISICAYAADFSDLRGHWAGQQINAWAEKGLVKGYADGTFKPNQEVTRAEFVVLVNRTFEISVADGEPGFNDVKAGQWYYKDIAAAQAAGYISGYADNSFQPGKIITRQEAASILIRLLKIAPTIEGIEKFKDHSQIPEWSRGSIGAVVFRNLMRGFPDETFKPARGITRAEAVVSLDRAIKASEGTNDETGNGNQAGGGLPGNDQPIGGSGNGSQTGGGLSGNDQTPGDSQESYGTGKLYKAVNQPLLGATLYIVVLDEGFDPAKYEVSFDGIKMTYKTGQEPLVVGKEVISKADRFEYAVNSGDEIASKDIDNIKLVIKKK